MARFESSAALAIRDQISIGSSRFHHRPSPSYQVGVGGCCGNTFVIIQIEGTDRNQLLERQLADYYLSRYQVDSALLVKQPMDHRHLLLRVLERDGSESGACGNGALLLAHAFKLRHAIVESRGGTFRLSSSAHSVSLSARQLTAHRWHDGVFVDVGEPHLVFFRKEPPSIALTHFGARLQRIWTGGINVNFLSPAGDRRFQMTTFERGVLATTASCGTGSLAAFAALRIMGRIQDGPEISISSRGGIHYVEGNKNDLLLTVRDLTQLYFREEGCIGEPGNQHCASNLQQGSFTTESDSQRTVANTPGFSADHSR